MLKKDNSDSVRMILAILLTGILFVFYGQYVESKTEILPTPNREGAVLEMQTGDEETLFRAKLSPNQSAQISSIPQEEKIIEISSEQLNIKFSTKNAVVVESLLKRKESYNFSLGNEPGYEEGAILISSDMKKRSTLDDVYYRIEHQSDQEIEFLGYHIMEDSSVIEVKKKYRLKEYELDMDLTFRSQSKGTHEFKFYIINGSGDGFSDVSQKNTFDITELSFTTNGKNSAILSPGFLSLFSGTKSYEELPTGAEWIALESRFYFQALRPLEGTYPSAFWNIDPSQSSDGLEKKVGAYYSRLSLSSGETKSYSFGYHFLPKSRELINQLYDERKLDYYYIFRQFSFMKVISDTLYFFMIFLYDMIKDYGLSIIIMTLFLKLIFFPLTQKSYKSMMKMQKISPKIEELRKKYKDNPTRLNTEMMALYKREDVNVLMGCLPMLIPIPIFIGLYILFQSMVELKGEHFLWIQDLAKPDNIVQFDSIYPFIGDGIRLMPFLLVLSQVLMNKYTTSAPQNVSSEVAQMQMKMIKYFLPAMFFIISWGIPSALTLYWLIQNLFTLGQNIYVRRTAKS